MLSSFCFSTNLPLPNVTIDQTIPLVNGEYQNEYKLSLSIYNYQLRNVHLKTVNGILMLAQNYPWFFITRNYLCFFLSPCVENGLLDPQLWRIAGTGVIIISDHFLSCNATIKRLSSSIYTRTAEFTRIICRLAIKTIRDLINRSLVRRISWCIGQEQ